MSAVARLLAFFEQYSDLKANLNFLSLQSQLERAENRIAVARRDYIEANRQPLKGNVPMPRWHGSWSRALNRRCRDCELAPKCDPIGLPSCGQAGMVSGPVGIGGFEEREFEGDSATVEVAAQIRLRGADPVQLRAQEIDEAAKLRIVVQCDPLGVHKVVRQRLRRAGGPVEIEPLGHDEDRKCGGIAARFCGLAPP